MRLGWVNPWWQATVAPARWNVCGFRLPALSVWHQWALLNIGTGGNAFVVGRAAATLDDAQALLIIAGRDWRAGCDLFYAPRLRARLYRRMHRRLAWQPEGHVLTACRDYADTCLRRAHRMQASGPAGSPAGAPEAWAIVNVLRLMGASEADAWNTPYARGRATLDVFEEHAGNATLAPWGYGEEMCDFWDDYKTRTGTRELVLN